MDWLTQAIVAGISAFVATNIDDILILTVFFAQVNADFRPGQIVLGQYLGFLVLIGASLPGFLGGLLIPKAWIGLLGFVPIAIGLHAVWHQHRAATEVQTVSQPIAQPKSRSWAGWKRFLQPQVYGVAAVTIGNGGDNIGIYVPLFASVNLAGLGVILGVFLIMIGVWCYIAYLLTQHAVIARFLVNYGAKIVPFVLIGLGIFILIESESYQLLFERKLSG